MKYYQITQYYKNEVNHSTIPCPANLTHIKKLIKCMAGDVDVLLVDDEDNSKQNLTDELGVRNQSVDVLHKIIYKAQNKTGKVYSYGSGRIYYLGDSPRSLWLKSIFMEDMVWSLSGMWVCSYTEKVQKKEKRNTRAGQEYERYIGQKYENEGFIVSYHGIENGKKDQGIDLIARSKNKICLIQCKNWLDSNNYRITHRDIRAFLGDCFLYKTENKIESQISMHFIISDEKILDASAVKFLKNQTLVKYKVVIFEK